MAKLPLIVLGAYAVLFFIGIMIARRSAATVEPNTGETKDNLEDLNPVSYEEIMEYERPWIGGYN